MRQYESDPALCGKSRGELEQQLWYDLSPELKQRMPFPEKMPMGFQLSWYDTMSTPDFHTVLGECLQTLRQNVTADMGNCASKTDKLDTHWMIRKPKGILIKRILGRIQ